MQVAILCGGLGTRLGSLTQRVPKSMVPIGDKPFLIHQVELLKRRDVTDIVLCIGHLGQQIRETCGDGRAWGVRIQYSDDGERLLGTAGTIKKAGDLLEDRFFVMNGDTFLPIDFRNVMDCFDHAEKLGMMVVYENHNRYDTSNVILEGGLVKLYDRTACHPDMAHIDAGVSVLRKEALKFIPLGDVSQLDGLYHRLIEMSELAAFETRQRFYEIGSPAGIEEFRRFVAVGRIPPC